MLPEERKNRRLKMVAATLQREVSLIILEEVKDPACSGVTIIAVKVSKDFSHAVISVRARSAELDVTDKALVGLNRASPYIRRELGSRIGLRKVPALRFVEDRGLVESVRVSELLRGLGFEGDNAGSTEPL